MCSLLQERSISELLGVCTSGLSALESHSNRAHQRRVRDNDRRDDDCRINHCPFDFPREFVGTFHLEADDEDVATIQELLYGLDALIRVHLWKEDELVLHPLASSAPPTSDA